MRCTDYIVWICGHIDGTNSTKEEQTLQEHLKTCPQCRKVLEEMQSNDAVLKENPLTPPDRILKNVMATVRKDAKKKTARIRSYILSAAAMAAVLCLVLMASLRTPELPGGGPMDRSMDTPTAAPAEPFEDVEQRQTIETDAMEYSLETAAVQAPAISKDQETRGISNEKSSPLQCVFVELPSRDMVPTDLYSPTDEEFLPRISREAQDFYFYGGSMIYGVAMMPYEDVQKWESQISFRFMHDLAESDTYVVVFCSESR